MLIIKIDGLDLEPLERALGGLPDVIRPAVDANWSVGTELEAEFGRDDHLLAERRKRFTNQFLVDEWTVNFGGIEKGDAAFDGSSDERDHLLPVSGRRAVAVAHSHAAEPDRRDFQVAVSEFAFLHFQLLIFSALLELRFSRAQRYATRRWNSHEPMSNIHECRATISTAYAPSSRSRANGALPERRRSLGYLNPR